MTIDTRRSSTATALSASLLTVLSVVAFPTDSPASDIAIEVDSAQRVSVLGRAPSLRAVIEDVCFRAGVDLVFFDATDRPFGGTYTGLPLRSFLDRALRRESYLAESVAFAGSGQERITRVRVLGDPSVAAARRAQHAGGRKNWQLPPKLLDAAFGAAATDSAERDAALATMAARITGDPAQLAGFLSTDPRQIAAVLRRYEGVEKPLRDLKASYPDPRIAHKIDNIVRALKEPASVPARP